jgi:hypothetical protein
MPSLIHQHDSQITLAWGQLGVVEPFQSDDSPRRTPRISDKIIEQLQEKFLQDPSKPVCFPIRAPADNASACLITTAPFPDPSASLTEIGILLSPSFSNVDVWRLFLRKIQVAGAKLLSPEGADFARPRGGSAAGNLLWLLQSLARTYTRTRELVKVLAVHNRFANAFRMLLL